MDSRESDHDDRAQERDREIERYREAATSTLEQRLSAPDPEGTHR
jgi:hypothetical protein